MDRTLKLGVDDPESPDAGRSAPARLGRFQLGKLLGQGGMGQVYEAYDPKLKRWVAVKLLRRSGQLDVHRFLQVATSPSPQS